MAATVRASAINAAGTGNTISVSAPAGTIAGDFAIVAIALNVLPTIVDDNGATPFAEDLDFRPNGDGEMVTALWSRRIQPGDPATYNFTKSGGNRWTAISIAVRDLDPSAAYDVAPVGGNNLDLPGDAAGSAVGITTLFANALHLVFMSFDANLGTFPAGPTANGYTLVQEGGNQPLSVYAKSIASPGATGDQAWTLSGAGAAWQGMSLAIKSAAARSLVPRSPIRPFLHLLPR